MVGASKKFTNPHTYDFSMAAYYSFDGGQTWNESPPLGLLAPWTGVSDPALTFDNLGNGTTRVTETVIGFGTGAKYDQLYTHLKGGNAEYLTMLADSFHSAK